MNIIRRRAKTRLGGGINSPLSTLDSHEMLSASNIVTTKTSRTRRGSFRLELLLLPASFNEHVPLNDFPFATPSTERLQGKSYRQQYRNALKKKKKIIMFAEHARV